MDLTKIKETWSHELTTSKILIVISLLILSYAYLPTLHSDYVTQDQWRAFRYSEESQSALERAKQCAKKTPGLYLLTGRPLVWTTECLEHALVDKITDFKYLRPIVFTIVIATCLSIGFVISQYVGGLVMGVFAATIFVMSPGYSFMYLQSMPAAMVLLVIILSTLSFYFLRKYMLDNSIKNGSKQLLLISFSLFFTSCCIYPAWAFIVLPLSYLSFVIDNKQELRSKCKYLGLMLIFYVISTALYYIFAKLLAFVLVKITGYVPHLDMYELNMQLTPEVILNRLKVIIRNVIDLSPVNFLTPYALFPTTLAIFSINNSYKMCKASKHRLFKSMLCSSVMFIIGLIVSLASVSPWLFSHMEALSARHLIPIYLLYIVTLISVAKEFCQYYLLSYPKITNSLILVSFVLPVAVIQHKLSSYEVIVSNVEITSIREKIHTWINTKGYKKRQPLLIVLPIETRPTIIENIYEGRFAKFQPNFVLTSSQNPVSIIWMVNAILREEKNHSIGSSAKLIDCQFNQLCVQNNLKKQNTIPLMLTKGQHLIKLPVQPYVINLSNLTSNPIVPEIDVETYG
ncbi:MAG: hypothetical protein P1U74_11010 [Legionellaceae bacterium]|nr:hypothetical protein [Legionellaceae bacterium]